MKHLTINQPLPALDVHALVVGVYQDGQLTLAAKVVDEATAGAVSRLVDAEEVTGKANELVTLMAPAGMKSTIVLLVGLGDPDVLDRRRATHAFGAAARRLAAKSRKSVAFAIGEDWPAPLQEAAVTAAIVGCVGQDLYKTKQATHPIQEFYWPVAFAAVVDSGAIIGTSKNLTRRLINEPPAALYPESFADHARDVAAESGLEIEIWDERRLEEERCEAMLAVARASSRPARLVMLRHLHGGDAPTLALVGKGVTFDSGGLSIKSSEGMKAMKCDMSGAAAVLGAMRAIGQLQLPLNVVGYCGMVENLIAGDGYKLGDVLTARNGKTIEVLNTDAEGRLVLADTLCVACDQGADHIIDLATLTGACMVALGLETVGVMTNNAEWKDRVMQAADAAGEYAWELPMWKIFNDHIKSKIADIKNIGNGRWGGAITAGKLLENFVGDVPWVHLDIAGPAFSDKPLPWLDAGGSGVMVSTLVEVARDFAAA